VDDQSDPSQISAVSCPSVPPAADAGLPGESDRIEVMANLSLRIGLVLALLGAAPGVPWRRSTRPAPSLPWSTPASRTRSAAPARCAAPAFACNARELSNVVVAVVPLRLRTMEPAIPSSSVSKTSRSLEKSARWSCLGTRRSTACDHGLANADACSASYDAQAKSSACMSSSRAPRRPGAPGATYEVNSQPASDGWRFAVDVPSGVYDLYLSPLPDCVSEFPPLWRGR